MKNILLTFNLLAVFLFPFQFSADCQPPSFHGLELGMTSKQVKAIFPSLKWDINLRYHVLSGYKYIVGEDAKNYPVQGIFSIEVWFVNDQLAKYKIQYNGKKGKQRLREFIETTAKENNLPIGYPLEERTCICSGTRISVAQENRFTIEIANIDQEIVINKMVEESYKEH